VALNTWWERRPTCLKAVSKTRETKTETATGLMEGMRMKEVMEMETGTTVGMEIEMKKGKKMKIKMK
jgi:hypothetical protein